MVLQTESCHLRKGFKNTFWRLDSSKEPRRTPLLPFILFLFIYFYIFCSLAEPQNPVQPNGPLPPDKPTRYQGCPLPLRYTDLPSCSSSFSNCLSFFFLILPSTSNPDSKLMSPGRPSNQNGEKDWENGCNASSPASVTEFTGEYWD